MPSEIPAAATKVKLAAIALHKIREENRIARKHLPALRAFFKQQKEQVLLRFVALKPIIDEQSAVKTNKAAPQVTQAAIEQLNKVWKGIEEDTTQDLQDLVLKIEQDAMQAGGDLMVKTINPTGKFWDLENPRAVAWFQKNGGSISKIKDIQATTADSLKRVITTALDEGMSYSVTAREIQKLYDGPISRERAQLIAVTETGNSYEAGNRLFADSLKDDNIHMLKAWQTSEDDRVSDGCQENQDAGWIELDEPFPSGHQQPLRFPGCRCYCIYKEAPKE